jgi:hypothetical protein
MVSTMKEVDPSIQDCIDECQRCFVSCTQNAMIHCLEVGDDHVEPEHFRLMLHCAEICRTAALFMLGGSSVHQPVCQACAQVCEACAESCDQVDGMDECAAACRSCASSCRRM